MNRLAQASSPYLRQHAGNPVDWYPWCDEAFARARADDKPLFVSIGYAACHWCHVMAHESFDDERTAAVLDRSFIAVKVDREERPDVDAIYMAAVQAMTGSGGWPMSVFCTPDGRPFFAGTYFPPSERHGMPSFRAVLDAVSDAWSERRADVEAQADALADALALETRVLDRIAPGPADDKLSWDALLERTLGELAERFDPTWGGFGPAPKFPRPAFVELCLRASGHLGGGGTSDAMTMAATTLDAMAAGGIYDHLEGGFARYSTDGRWLVPHFEKMLPDQALLVRAYLHAWQVTGSPTYLQVVRETIEFVCDVLSTPEGGFCASLDADAGGVEGGHATWTPAEVRAAIATEAAADAKLAGLVCDWYGVTDAGNFEGRTILHRPLGAGLIRPAEVEVGRRALLAARRGRQQPARDDKVLTEWHAMFTVALAEAAWVCGEERWAARAVAAADHLFARNRRADGRWLRSADSGVPAFAADYAWLVECCTWLATLTGRAVWTERAQDAAADLLDLFWDDERGGLFTTGHDAEPLVARPKDVLDGAVPSANAIGAMALLRVGALTSEARWTRAGERIVDLAAPLARQQPLAVADALAAAAFAEGAAEIVVVGEEENLLAEVRQRWLPDAVVAWGEPTATPLWEGRSPGTAYVCRRSVCKEPARDATSFAMQLDALAIGSHR